MFTCLINISFSFRSLLISLLSIILDFTVCVTFSSRGLLGEIPCIVAVAGVMIFDFESHTIIVLDLREQSLVVVVFRSLVEVDCLYRGTFG